MKKPQPPQRDTRTEILTAAIDILHEHGAGALTVRSVATAAGCSTTGVYTWFGGKNGLVEAIFIDGFQRFGAALDAARATTPSDHHVVGLAHAYRAWALANPTHYMVMFASTVPDFSPSVDALITAHGTFQQLVDATAAHMRRVGDDADPAEVAHHLWAGMHGYVSLEIADMDMAVDENHRTRRFEAGLRMLTEGVLRRSSAPAPAQAPSAVSDVDAGSTVA